MILHSKLLKIFINWQQKKANSLNRQIFSAAVITAITTVVVKLLAASKEIAVAYYFGTSSAVDAFLVAFVLPSFAINVLSASLITSLMPVYIDVKENHSLDKAYQLFSSSMILGIIFLVVVTCLLSLIAPYIVPILCSGFDSLTRKLCLNLFYILIPSVVINGLIKLYATVLNANKYFIATGLVPILVPICAIIGLFLFHQTIGIYALAIGTIVGMVLEVIVLILVIYQKKIPILPRWYGINSHLKKVIKGYFPWVGSAILMSSKGLIDTSMAAMLAPGSVASLGYGNKVVAIILNLGSAALATAILPYISNMVAKHDWKNFKLTFKTYTKIIFITTIPLSALLFIFSENIIALLFERGNFLNKDTIIVANILSCYTLQIPFYTFDMFGVRLLTALGLNKFIMKVSAINLSMNIVGNYILTKIFGVAGIALSTSLAYLTSGLFIGFTLYKITKSLKCVE